VIDRGKVWTGELNERVLGDRSPAARVGLYDTTLRDGEQTVGVVLDPEQKLRIAKALDALGIDRIEAGFPRVSADDVEAFRLITAAHLDAEIWGFSRAVPADVEALLELGVKAAVIESPVSDGKLAAYGIPRERLLERVRAAVATAVEHDMTVCFFGVDGSRADLGFLERVYREAVEAGARELAVVDTLGIASP
jgi:isopropylmalate/homocitrate/citramalate synthase